MQAPKPTLQSSWFRIVARGASWRKRPKIPKRQAKRGKGVLSRKETNQTQRQEGSQFKREEEGRKDEAARKGFEV